MTRYFYEAFFFLLVSGLAVLFAYKTSVPPAEPAAQVGSDAQFGGVSLRLVYATTSASRERGLGGRTSLASDEAMLFVFPKDDFYGFWMKDILMSLDMFWLNAQGQVISIAGDVATSSYPNVFYPTAPARYVLETVAGFARSHAINTGTSLHLKNFPSVVQ
jgi:uncharacterized protein